MASGQINGDAHVSFGVAVFPEHGLSPKELMAAADAALYEAKRLGAISLVATLRSVEDLTMACTAVPASQKSIAGWS